MYSLLNKRWILRDPTLETAEEISSSLDLLPVVSRLLVNRKVEGVDEAEMFVRAKLSSLHDPFLISGMELAVDRILMAIEN